MSTQDQKFDEVTKNIQLTTKKYLKGIQDEILRADSRTNSADHQPRQPDRVYHYTTASGLRGILESGSMHATHARHLNDPEEVRHGLKLIERALKKLEDFTQTLPEHCRDICARLLEEAARDVRDDSRLSEHSNGAYFLSFSKRRDDLNQFRVYSAGGAGYCIGFDFAKLETAVKRIPYAGGSLFAPVHLMYDDTRAIEILKQCTSFVVKEIPTLQKLFPPEHPRWRDVTFSLSTILIVTAIRFKQNGYKDENELRFAPSPWFPSADALPTTRLERIKEAGGHFIKYLEISIGSIDSPWDTLREIITGPKLDPITAPDGVYALLYHLRKDDESRNSDDIEVSFSQTRLR